MNSFPVKMLDEAGSTLMGFFAENETRSSGARDAMQDRGHKVESRGIYAGRAAVEGAIPSMAAR